MKIPSFLAKIVATTSLAAMFVAAPISAKFDQAGNLVIANAMANADAIPDDCEVDCGPIEGPIDPPTCEGQDCEGDGGGGPVCVGPDCEGGGGGPVCEGPDCEGGGGGPVDPVDPIDPIDYPVDACDQQDAPDKCNEPKPAVATSPSDDDDDVPSTLPVSQPIDTPTPQDEGMDFAKTLRCQTACSASVANDGDVTVTLTSTTTGGDPVKTTITQDGEQVATRVVLGSAGGDEIIVTADENFGSRDKARDVVAERVGNTPVTFALDVDFPDQGEQTQDFRAEIVDSLSDAVSSSLDIPISRFSLLQLSEG